MVSCLNCINSGCCKLSIQVSKKEYDSLNLTIQKHFTIRIDEFFKKSPELKAIRQEIEPIFYGNYAEMHKNNDGYCPLLDRKSMLCSVYEDRPKTCQDYTNDRCDKIRLMKYEI